jgi:Fe-Mn family superoxide dismutase
MAYELPPLPYAYDALEPHLDARTMEIHHGKHHAAYVNNTNAALEGYPELQAKTIEQILTDLSLVPEAIRTQIRNHGGGFANHTLYWNIMSPAGGGEPGGSLKKAIEKAFGEFGAFRDTFSKAALTQFGSGWAWLAADVEGNLKLFSTMNQDTPLSMGMTPIMTVDVWEHAYYLKFQNRRADFIATWWNVVNWPEIMRNFEVALG